MNRFVGVPSWALSRGPFLGAQRSLARTVEAAAKKALVAKAHRGHDGAQMIALQAQTRKRLRGLRLRALRAQERHRRLVHAGRDEKHRTRPRREARRGSGTTRRGPQGAPLGRRYPSDADARRTPALDVCRWRAAGHGADADADVRRMRTRHRRRRPAGADAAQTLTRRRSGRGADADAART
jgi:hypothetical protein